MIFKFLKFVIVGFSGMIIDFSVTLLLKEKLKVQRYIASSTGFVLAASSNYLINRYWTFQSSNPRIFEEYGTFLLISIIGLGINNLFIYIFERKVHFYFAKFLSIIVTAVWNFAANYYFNFTR